MQVPIHDYYSDAEYEFALRQMRRMMERRRIETEARLANQARKRLKSDVKSTSKTIISETSETLKNVLERLDSAIEGECRDKIEEVSFAELLRYSNIVN